MKEVKIERDTKIDKFLDGINYDLEGSVDSVIQFLIKLKEKYSSEYHTLNIERYSMYDGGVSYELHGLRNETDEEYNSRLAAEANRQRMDKIKKAKEADKELELYKKLKEKYEK